MLKQFVLFLVVGHLWISLCATAQMMESFEDVPIGQMPPRGWLKWEEAGGRGWSNSWHGRKPMPGWMSGTNTVPPDPDAGSRLAYVTYTHGGSKTNDLWLITPTLKGITATSTVSFWYRSSFSNFADRLYVMISTNPQAYRKSDFSIEAFRRDFPRGYPYFPGERGKDFPEWSNIVVNIGSMVPAGMDIRLGFCEYYWNNWYDVRANEMDVIRSDLWSPPALTTLAVRAVGDVVEVDVDIFPGYPAGEMGVCWGMGPEPKAMDVNRREWFKQYASITNRGESTCVISNLPSETTWWIRPYVNHKKGFYYGNQVKIYGGDSAGRGGLSESFETTPIGQMPPPGWCKWQEAGGRGWSNSWSGRRPMPGWMAGTNSCPPGGGDRTAYVTYTHGGSKTNDLWLISPTIENVPPDCKLSFWQRNSFTNFSDKLYVYISDEPGADRKADFDTEMWHLDMPRGAIPGYVPPGTGDFGDWSNVIVNVTDYVDPGSDVRIAFREYYWNNWYDVRTIELDLIEMGDPHVRHGLWFNGVDDQVQLPFTNMFNAFTIEAWVKPDQIGAMNILVSSSGSPLTWFSRQLNLTSDGRFEFYNYDGSTKSVSGTTVAQTGHWYHVAGTAQKNGTMKLYVNGAQEGPSVNVGNNLEGGLAFYLGAATGRELGRFNGAIDEVRVWDRVRSETEIRASMNVYLRGVEEGLQACYRMDEGFGGDVFNNSQIPHGGGWFCSATQSYIWARQAAYYDGVDDFTTMPVTSSANYTLYAWVRPESSGAQNIMVCTSGDPMTDFVQQLRINSSGCFEHYTFDGTARTITGTTVVQPGTWYHVSGKVKDGGYMRLFVNGLEEGTAISGVNALWSAPTNCYIAARSGGGVAGWFKGRIRDAAVLATAKNQTALRDMYLAGVTSSNEPIWVASDAPQGNAELASQTDPRGIWSKRTSFDEATGMDLQGTVSLSSNFAAAGHNDFSGLSSEDAPSTGGGSRLARIWYVDLHGGTQMNARFEFTPSEAGADSFYMTSGQYALWWREGKSGPFSVYDSSPDSQTGGSVVFDNVPMTAGYYTLGLAPPPAPVIQSASGITAYTFTANWSAVPDATNYLLDVSVDSGFSSMVDGYNDRIVGSAVSMSVTGLNPGVTYRYRVRAQHEGGVSTNSADEALTTLTEGSIQLDVSAVTLGGVYWGGAVTNSLVCSNSGQTAYACTSTVHYSESATGWLDVLPGTLINLDPAAVTSLTMVADFSLLNAGTYTATVRVQSVTATNSPQLCVVSLVVSQAAQTISFAQLDDCVVTNLIGLQASADSGLDVALSVGSGAAVIVGSTNLSFFGSGWVDILANQAGNSNWLAAFTLTNRFHVRGMITNVVPSSGPLAGGNMVTVYGYAIGSGADITNVSLAGIDAQLESQTEDAVTITAGAAGSVGSGDVVVHSVSAGTMVLPAAYTYMGSQSISAFLPTNGVHFIVTNEVVLSAEAGSGLDVSFSVADGPGLIAGQTNLTFSNTGVVFVAASQPGNQNWYAADTLTNMYVIHGVPVVGPVTLLRYTNQLLKFTEYNLLTNAVDPEGSELTVEWVSSLSSNAYALSMSNHWITYEAPVTAGSNDLFSFLVKNVFGGTTPGQARIEIVTAVDTNSMGPSKNIAGLLPSGDDVYIRFIGIPGRFYHIQASTNLSENVWTNIGACTIGSEGNVIFIHSNAPPSSYYRTVRPE